jgi:hypothetical protein
MTSQQQIDANRRNARLSTGPRTAAGKNQSRGNAYRHGLTAETVIVGLEDAADYHAFEAEIVADYDPKSVLERELTCRLASLLWRLRRASLIESGLLRIDAERASGMGRRPDAADPSGAQMPAPLARWLAASAHSAQRADRQWVMTQRFLRMVNVSGEPLDRISRYEARLWRQFLQVLLALDRARHHRIVAARGRFTPHPPQW